jgi:hypothetical protein
MKKIRLVIAAVVVIVISAAFALTSCAGLGAFGETLNRAFQGVPATMTTYTQGGELVDEVKGQSFQTTRDTKFDTTDSDGKSKNDSSVLLISLGNSHISHVGSSMILAQDGLTNVSASLDPKVSFSNTQSGTPWLNNIIKAHRDVWQGKGKTIMIRSQDGTPIAVYAGNQVENLATDVPKSTWFRVDGKYLFVYRCDYTVYDNDLLEE